MWISTSAWRISRDALIEWLSYLPKRTGTRARRCHCLCKHLIVKFVEQILTSTSRFSFLRSLSISNTTSSPFLIFIVLGCLSLMQLNGSSRLRTTFWRRITEARACTTSWETCARCWFRGRDSFPKNQTRTSCCAHKLSIHLSSTPPIRPRWYSIRTYVISCCCHLFMKCRNRWKLAS